MAQKSFAETFRAGADTVFDAAFWNAFVDGINIRLKPLEQIKIDYEALSQGVLTIALDRINEVLLPAATKIQNVAALGFLTAPSATPITLVANTAQTFFLTAGDLRDLFTPSPFLAITREGSIDDLAVGRLAYYNVTTGQLDVLVDRVYGDPGPHSDWIIAAVGGTVLAQGGMLDESRNLREETEALKNQAVTAAGTATDKAGVATLKASNATTSAQAAEAAFLMFDKRYLGAKSSDPTLDNQGDPLIQGALYSLSASPFTLRYYTGSAWRDVSNFSINQLLDVDIETTPPVSGEGLVWDGAKFIPGPAGGGMFNGNNGVVGNRSGDIFRVSAQTVTRDVTIAAGQNAYAPGPITVAPGKTLTVEAGANLVIL